MFAARGLLGEAGMRSGSSVGGSRPSCGGRGKWLSCWMAELEGRRVGVVALVLLGLLLELPPDSRREDHGGISVDPGLSFALWS